MNPNDNIVNPTGYRLEFTASLPLDECVRRIRDSFDKRMGMNFAHMQGYLQKIDAVTYEFSLYQELKNQRVTISGRFVAQSASTTLVKAWFRRDYSAVVWIAAIPLLFMMIGSCFAASLIWGLVALAILTALVGLYLYSKQKTTANPQPNSKYAPASELLWYFERTLKQ